MRTCIDRAEDINITDTSTSTCMQITGPITRARARKLNDHVSSFLSLCSAHLDHGHTRVLMLLRNNGEDQYGKGFAQTGFGLQNNANL